MTREVTQADIDLAVRIANLFGKALPHDADTFPAQWIAEHRLTAQSGEGQCKYNICDGSGTFYDKVDGECRCICQSGEGRSGAGEDAVAEEAARSAMRNAEVARTDIVKPVNGSAPYAVVMFHGQRVEFHDGEWTIDMHRDAGTGKAAAYAQAINSALFDLAKNAALAALNARQSGEGERNRAIEDIAAERQRQIETEGWTPEHDDVHADGGELSRAAACYAAHASAFQRVTVDLTAYRTADPARHDYGWPWSSSWWKPSTPRRDLVKAGALIVAEIERLDRAALRATDDAGGA